jgi:hypothetical protein
MKKKKLLSIILIVVCLLTLFSCKQEPDESWDGLYSLTGGYFSTGYWDPGIWPSPDSITKQYMIQDRNWGRVSENEWVTILYSLGFSQDVIAQGRNQLYQTGSVFGIYANTEGYARYLYIKK